jgi:diacylglycerol kinase (ATP)
VLPLTRAALTAAGIRVLGAQDAARPDAFVVAGGDGSIVHALPEAIALKVPLGLIPTGTFNDLARTLRIPFDVAAACAIVAAGVTRAIDVARVNGVYYVNEASIGASSRIARLQHSREKQRLGWGAVAESVINGLRYVRPFRATIESDDRADCVTTIQITVANSYHFGGVINVRGAAIDDGLLDCYVVEAGGLFPVLALTAAVLRGDATGLRGLKTYRGQRIRVTSPHAHRVTADGEPAGRTPATFEVLPGAVKVFAPPA